MFVKVYWWEINKNMFDMKLSSKIFCKNFKIGDDKVL